MLKFNERVNDGFDIIENIIKCRKLKTQDWLFFFIYIYIKRKSNKTEEISLWNQVPEHRKLRSYSSVTEPSEVKNCPQNNFFILVESSTVI